MATNGLTRGAISIDSPVVVPTPTILDVVDVETGTDSHRLMGVVYEELGWFPATPVTMDPNSCIATATKTGNGLLFANGEPPIAVYAAVECGMFPAGTDFLGKATERLARGEGQAIERYLWENVFPGRAVDLTPGGTAVSPLIALGILEEYAGKNYTGIPTLHTGKKGLMALAHNQLIFDLLTPDGVPVVPGGGYYSTDGGAVAHHANLLSPVLTKGSAASGGTFAAGSYFWVITAINAAGETLASNEVTATLTANQQQVLNWTAITGATGYKVYRGVATGAENKLVATLGAVITYTDTGIAGTTAALPASNTAAVADTYTAAGSGNVWLYMTGSIQLIRGQVEAHMFDDVVHNDAFALAEREYVPVIDGFVVAIKMVLE